MKAFWKGWRPATGRPLLVSSATETGLVRINNEDFVRTGTLTRGSRSLSVVAVADGVGGGPDGEIASRAAVDALFEALESSDWSDVSDALKAAFGLANRRVSDVSAEGRAATTMVAAVVAREGDDVTVANVGDSRAYLVVDGHSRQITQDHSLVATKVAAGLMTAAEARTAPDRNLLTRAVGSGTGVEVDVFECHALGGNERIVLCSDGVHGLVDDEEIGGLASGPIEGAAAALVGAAIAAGGYDNATAVVAGFAPEPASGRHEAAGGANLILRILGRVPTTP
jgi:serine/threonine protein phosphatase PrpC